jgi:hypothetical protein
MNHIFSDLDLILISLELLRRETISQFSVVNSFMQFSCFKT